MAISFPDCNGIGQVISFIWTAGTGTVERVPQAKELLSRFEKFGGMNTTTGENLPCFVSDLCCNDRGAITMAGFSPLTAVVGDVFHVTKRILSSASTSNRPAFGQFAADLRKCFGSTSPGIFWPGEKILLAIEEVRKRYEAEDMQVWT